GVVRAGDEIAAVGRKAERADVASVPFEPGQRLAGEGVPESDRGGVQVAGHDPAVQGEGETGSSQIPGRITIGLSNGFAGRQFHEESGSLAARSAHQDASAGRYRSHRSGEVGTIPEQLAGFAAVKVPAFLRRDADPPAIRRTTKRLSPRREFGNLLEGG